MDKNARISSRLTESDRNLVDQMHGDGVNNDTEIVVTALRKLYHDAKANPKKVRRLIKRFERMEATA